MTNTTISTWFLAVHGFVWVCSICATPLSSLAQETALQIHLRNGSVIHTRIDQQQLKWTDVEQSSEDLNWSEITELKLIHAPVSQQVERVQRLIEQLSSPDYRQREEAEKKLSNVDFSGPFKSLIAKSAQELKSHESRYRIQRVLKALSEMSESDEVSAGFDEVKLNNGSIRIGDATNFQIRCHIFGQEKSFDRKSVGRITITDEPVASDADGSSIATQTFNQISQDFYKSKNDVFIGFENDSNGNPITLGKAVDNFFTEHGLLMRTEKPGFIQLTKYPFKFCPIDSGSRCVCPYDEETDKRLRGATILNFCLPGQPTTVAGVHKFGVFLERVEHSRDFVVEAYNALGQMIGMVEATDKICTFAGFKSNELITQIRISKNNDLPDLDRPIDETYAFDCVTFDPPKKIVGLTRASDEFPHAARINLTSGDSLLVDEYKINTQQLSFTNPLIGGNSKFDWNDVHSVSFPQLRLNDNDPVRKMLAQLQNGSIVRVEDESITSAFDFIGHEFKRDEIVGFWNTKARLPLETDFTENRPILIYPSCRIQAEQFEFEPDSIEWDSSTSQKLVQDVQLSTEEEDAFAETEQPDPDMTPQTNKVNFVGKKNDIPSVWFKAPPLTNLKDGHLLLNDSQFFVLKPEGSASGFRVTEINQAKKILTLEFNGDTKFYPLGRVVSLSLPKSN